MTTIADLPTGVLAKIFIPNGVWATAACVCKEWNEEVKENTALIDKAATTIQKFWRKKRCISLEEFRLAAWVDPRGDPRYDDAIDSIFRRKLIARVYTVHCPAKTLLTWPEYARSVAGWQDADFRHFYTLLLMDDKLYGRTPRGVRKFMTEVPVDYAFQTGM